MQRLKPALPPNLDYSKVFLTYVSLLGNCDQTAVACDLDPTQVRILAERDNWDVKVTALLAVKERQGAEAFARELNRTANFVQALRCRNLLDQTLQFFTNQGSKDGKVSFEQLLTHRGAKGETNLSAKNIADLTKAIETVHRMTYAALGDTAPERTKAAKDGEGEGDQDPSMSMVRALAQLNSLPAGSAPVGGFIPVNASVASDEVPGDAEVEE